MGRLFDQYRRHTLDMRILEARHRNEEVMKMVDGVMLVVDAYEVPRHRPALF